MAKNDNTQQRTAVDEVNDSLTSLEQRVQNNQRTIMWGILAVGVVVCLILVWIYAVRRPGIEAANTAIGQADFTMTTGNDSTALAQYEQVADNYGHEAGNRANLNAAIILYRQGEYQKAIDRLKDYSPREEVIGAASRSLMGDCYVNLKDYDQALRCFREAAAISDHNPHYTPLFMIKEANVLRELKDYKAEAEVYRTIQKDYPIYGNTNAVEIEKYLKRAELQAAAAQ